MPGISMCSNDETCPVKRQCYRSKASGTKPLERQAWAAFRPDYGEICPGHISATLCDSLDRLSKRQPVPTKEPAP